MGRLLFTVVLLAAYSVSLAGAAPAHSEKAHRHAAAKPGSRAKTRHRTEPAAARVRRRSGRPSSTRSNRAAWEPRWRSAGHGSHSAVALPVSRTPRIRAASLRTHRGAAALVEKPLEQTADSVPEPSADPSSAQGDETPAVSSADASSADSPPDSAAAPDSPAAEPSLDATAAAPSAFHAHETLRAAEPISPAEPAAIATLRIPRTYVPPLRGSRESLIRQNERSEAEGLERIEDNADLNDRIARKLLVPLPASSALTVNDNLPEEFRYCRPWTARLLADLARAHDAVFHRPIVVSSAVRTIAYQRRLERINGNAAPAEGDIVSPHLTGATIDIAKEGLPRSELAWMRAWLGPLQASGKIDVEEEFQQACFHITVYESYVPPAPARQPGAKPRTRRRPAIPTALAVKTM